MKVRGLRRGLQRFVDGNLRFPLIRYLISCFSSIGCVDPFLSSRLNVGFYGFRGRFRGPHLLEIVG